MLIFRRTIVITQHLVSSLSLGDCSVHRLRVDSMNLRIEQVFSLNGQRVKHGNVLHVRQWRKLMTVAQTDDTGAKLMTLAQNC